MQSKIIIAGLSSKFEAVIAPPSYLCGKTTTQILSMIPESICLDALVCYLNLEPIFSFYKAIFSMRGFSPNSFSIGPRQIEQIPIPAKKYFKTWSPIQEITPYNQLSYWGKHYSELDPSQVNSFILALLGSN